MITMKVFFSEYKLYRDAVELLKKDNTTVVERKAAIEVRNRFETDMRLGIYDELLYHTRSY
jgi:hypothetical protein